MKQLDQEFIDRRTSILKLLLEGSIILLILTNALYFSVFLIKGNPNQSPPFLTLIILLFFILLRIIFSKTNRKNLVGIPLILTYYLGSLFSLMIWGIDLPQGLLIIGFVIVVSAVVISERSARYLTGITCILIIVIGYLQSTNHLMIVRIWRVNSVSFGDAVVESFTFCLIFLIAWLFNREIEKALLRALASEEALKDERDLLEVRVKERTEELVKLQHEHLLQLERFALFGRQAAGLLHDLLNPISAQLLTIEQLKSQTKEQKTQENLGQLLTVTERIQAFIKSSKRSLRAQANARYTNMSQEVEAVFAVLASKAEEMHVSLINKVNQDHDLLIDPILLQKLLQNLVSNAIEAYAETHETKREVVVTLTSKIHYFYLSVTDFGQGIHKKDLPHLFDPFFTTKQEESTGLGLNICQEIAEQLQATITVQSTKQKGTIFSIKLPKPPDPV